jgi:multidrug efflux system membrane fusion protein
MASRIFKPSRIFAVLIVLAAVAWIASGYFGPQADEHEAEAGAAVAAAAPVPVQKVSVTPATPEKHERLITLSCVTEADQQSVAVARGAGVIIELKVSRGTPVNAGDTVAVISDEGRESAVKQAEALLGQRRAEYEANKTLIDRGDAPKNRLPELEAAVATAEAGVAAAKAEWERSNVTSPVAGIVDEVPVQVGQAVQPGATIAEIVGPDPMLAVGAVSERQRGHLRIGQNSTIRFIDGTKVNGTVSFVGLSAEKATRTYRVEARIPNPDSAIADGVTCELVVVLEPIEAVAVPRSALVFSDGGELGIRIVDGENKAQFVPVSIVDDGLQSVWVTGVKDSTRVIVVGQDFVKDGDAVEAVVAAETAPKAEPPA